MDIISKKISEEYKYIQVFQNDEEILLSDDLTHVNLYNAYVKNNVSGYEFIKNIEKKLNLTRTILDNSKKYKDLQELRFMDEMGLTHIMPGIWKEIDDNKIYENISEELKHNTYYNFSRYINVDQKYSTISLDGPSACGKSTTIDFFKRKDKIKNYIGNLSATYNLKPSSALNYAILNYRLLTESQNTIIDRSPISNIAYQLCYYIMDRISNHELEADRYTLTAFCKEYIEIHNLMPYLEFLNASNLNIIIILDSNFEKVSTRLFNRGIKYNNPSDVARSTVYCYLKAQNAAFAYLANELDYYTLDINFYRLKYSSVNESDLFDAISNHLKFIINDTINTNQTLEEFPKIMYLNTFAETPERMINNISMLVHCSR